MMSQIMMKTLRIVTKELQRMKGTNNKSLDQTKSLKKLCSVLESSTDILLGKTSKYFGMTWTSKQRKQNLNFYIRRVG